MSVHRPKEWIATVIGKFDKLLASSVTHNVSLPNQLESHKECIINISESKCPMIISGLTNSLRKLSNIRIYGNRQEYNLYTSQIVVLNLLEKCISAKDSALPEDSILIKQLLSEICQFLHQPSNEKVVVEQLKASASRVLFSISQNNFNIVFGRIANRLHDLSINTEDVNDLSDLDLIQHVHIDVLKLTKLLDEIILKFRNLKRCVQLSLLNNLHVGLWGCVCTYPVQLNLLYQNSRPGFNRLELAEGEGQLEAQTNREQMVSRYRALSSSAEKLFDVIDNSIEGSRKKASQHWPLQTLLLLLCPELVRQAENKRHQPRNNKNEHLSNLKRHLTVSSTRQIQENCVDSFVRLIKVATCVAPSNGDREKMALHKLAETYLPELQSFLFDTSSKYFSKTSDQDPLIECFVSSFRLNPEDTSLPHLCASTGSSVNHKMVLVQALRCISEQACLPWWPKVDQLYNYGSDIRKIFRDCATKIQTQIHTSPRSTQSIRERMERMNVVGLKRSQDDTPNHRDLLRVILQLIQSNPSIVLHNLGSSSQQIHPEMFDFANHLVLLFSSHLLTNPQIALETSGALLRLHDADVIMQWNPEAPMFTFWEVNSLVLSNICGKLLTNQMMTPPEMALHAVKWLQQILARRIEFLMQNHAKPGANSNSDIVHDTKLKLEQTLMEHLWHHNEDLVAVALTCFQGLYEETELRWSSVDDSLIGRLNTERFECYHELSTAVLVSDGDVIQARVKSVLRRISKFPRASLQAWEDTLNKWEVKTHSLSYKQNKDDYVVPTSSGESPAAGKSAKKSFASEQDVADWTNMTGFLCSLGGVCAKSAEVVSSSTTSLVLGRRTSSSSVLSSSAGPSSQPDPNSRIGSGKTPSSVGHASRFIGHLINMLAKANSRIVDVTIIIRDLLASDLHPALYPTLFQQITLTLKSLLFDSNGMIVQGPLSDQLVRSVIHILDNIFRDCSEEDGEYFGEESIEAAILYIVRYIRQMGMKPSAIELRIFFCKLVTELMNRKSDFFFLSEIKFRNKLVEHLADWLMASSNQNGDTHHVLLRELDESAVVAIGSLLDGLPLHPDEGDGGDVPKAKSQLFLKYFTLFMRLLSADEYQCVDMMVDDVIGDVSMLRSSVVVAMSNLLSANIEYGLVHAMGLAYHPDIQTRAAFLEVLIKILQQGTARFDTLGDGVSAERFESLVELVTMMGDNGELPIANALANVVHTTYMDELARVFVTLFDAKHLLYQLLWNMFTKEVEEAPSVQTLFRGNSLASKIMTFCFKVYGASYLHNLVEPLVAWSLGPDIVSLQFEVDQKRIPAGVDILQCRNNLQLITERFFTRIMTSTDKFPPQLKSVCHCLYQVVSQRFHESGTGAVASAIFLRFLNPAIATPYEMGLSEKPIPPNLAKAFKFMCKLMQNIANHVLFTKEEHMKHFNEFVQARFEVCQQFFMQISTPECASIDSVVHSNSIVNGSNVQALHRLLWNDQEKIGQFLAKSRSAKAVGRKPYDKMVTLLAYLGPPEYTRPMLETRTVGQAAITPCITLKFEELMNKRKVPDSDQYKMVKSLNIFYQFGRSKMGYPVFYYIAKRYVQSEIREDTLMFYILQALKPYSSRKFDVIIDLTHVDEKNGFRRQHLPKWLLVYTPQIYKNLSSVYVYNPNSWVMDYVTRNQSFFDKLNQSRIVFLSHLSDLQEHIDLDHQKIPSATKSLDEDTTVFRNVNRSGHQKIDLKIGRRAVQFTSVEKFKLLGNEVTLNDIFYANEIESIQSVDDNHTFGLKMAFNNSVAIFTHPDAFRIAQGLRHIRARWELTQPKEELSTPHHKISAKDVPGTLLNMALLNLGCPDPGVRSCAYNLLCVLTSCFNLQLEGRLCESDDLCIPANNTLFIVSISTTLAKNERHLTLEFLDECITGYRCLSDTLKNLCLEYMEPWLFNLPSFVSPSDYKRNKVKSVIHKLIDLTIVERDFYPSVQIKVWGNLGILSPLTDLILEAFVETSSQGGLGSLKAEVMADTSVSLAVSNMMVVSSKLINLLCTIVDKTSLRPTPTLEKHKHWDEIAILARFLLMLSFNNNLDVITHLPNLFHLVSLLVSTGPLSLRASIHGLVVNIIHSLLTCSRPEFKEPTRQVLRLSLTEFCLPKFYLYFGISNVKSAADTAFKAELGTQGNLLPAVNGNVSCQEMDNIINLSYLDEVIDRMLEVMEACSKDVSDCDWLSEWRDLSQKFAFQYNPSLQPRALVVFGCINKRPTLRHIKKIMTIMAKSLESQADPILLESTLLAITRLQHVTSASLELKATLFWVAIFSMQMNVEHLYAAGLSLLEQNLHHLDELGLFASQEAFVDVLVKSRQAIDRYVHSLEVAVGLSFQLNFHFAFVTHLIKGFRHTDQVVIARLIRILDFCLELLSRNRACHKYEINSDSAPYITALLPMCDEVRRHCVPRRKVESLNGHSTTSSRRSNGRQPTAPPSVHSTAEEPGNCSDTTSSGSHSSRSHHSSVADTSSAVTSKVLLTVADARHGVKAREVRNKRTDSRETGTTPPKMRKVGEASHDSDSSSSGSHVTSSSVRSSRRKHSIDSTGNALFGYETLDQKTQALLITLLATLVKHSPKNSEVQVLFEYLAEASHIFPAVFPIVHSLLDHKINSILNQCDDAAILGHVQTIVQNAASNNTDDSLSRQITLLQEIGFSGMWRFAGPFAQVASLESAPVFVNLVDTIVSFHMGDVPDLTPVASRQSLNSALSAASVDDFPESEEFDLSDLDCDEDDVIEVPRSAQQSVTAPVQSPKTGSFRNKGPKLTIRVPS